MNSMPPTDTFNVVEEEQQQQQQQQQQKIDIEKASWVHESPNPPGLWHEFIGSLKETLFPHGNKKLSSSSSKKQFGCSRIVSFLQGVFPILSWGRNYKASKFKKDLMAGLTLASLCIPQSIGYAGLAKLDPQYGLYTSIVPPLIYALMGSSRELAIGPVAVVSLLLSALIQKIEDPVIDPVGYRKLVFTATFFAGTFQAIFGCFRLGFLVDFLSHAAIVGFMGGAAIVIGLQQLKGLFGLTHFTNKTDVISVLKSVLSSIHHTVPSHLALVCTTNYKCTAPCSRGSNNLMLGFFIFFIIFFGQWYPLNFLLGCSFLIFILITRFLGRRNKKLFWLPAMAPLISVIISTLIVYLTKADNHGVKIVKHIKSGLNPSSVHQLTFNGPHVGQAARIGLISAVVALAEAIAVGRSFASVRGYHLDGNKEMVAMGFMNIVGSLTSCYVATGSFSRTAVNFSAGCETVVSNIVMSLTVFISLELFTRLLYYTPISILASIILSALPGLIDINEAYYIWKVDKLDFLACIGAFFGVLFASVEIGLLAAVIISFAKIILNSIRPNTEIVGRLPGTDIYCDTNQYPMATKTPGILIVGINSGLLCFVNSNFIRERIMQWMTEEDDEAKDESKQRLQAVILDMSNVTNIDISGILALEELHKKMASQGIQLAMANPRWQVIHKLKLAKFVERIGKGWVFLTVNEAVDACLHSKIISC